MRNRLSAISIPKFVDLKMGLSSYFVTVTLNITEEIAKILSVRKLRDVEVFCWKNRWYISHKKLYTYSDSLEDALYKEAYRDLAHLKIIIREVKISILKGEIECIADEWSER